MSLETLGIYDTHRAAELEDGPFSQEFQIVGGGTFKGIYDNSYTEGKRDRGGIQPKARTPRILVSEIPDGLKKGSEVTFESQTYKVSFDYDDVRGVPIIWLL